MCYQSGHDGTIYSVDLLQQKNLKQLEFCSEQRMYSQRDNIFNHCDTYKCSGYLWQLWKHAVNYDPTQHDAYDES